MNKLINTYFVMNAKELLHVLSIQLIMYPMPVIFFSIIFYAFFEQQISKICHLFDKTFDQLKAVIAFKLNIDAPIQPMISSKTLALDSNETLGDADFLRLGPSYSPVEEFAEMVKIIIIYGVVLLGCT